MGQALYRKYRSRSLDEVVGQEHVVKTLKNALKNNMISHAYLFTGPRGVGKTSVARILAHEINQLPYKGDTVNLDIIEIDAASNRRIDEIRDLREKVHIAPTAAKYKVYIIDEVHMLTKEAFNALLKTLEEPPAHCVFILATTEAHKLPETIVSRTQRFTFKPINKKQTADHLEKISAVENIKISRDALELLAEHGEGSFRDSISLLDQLSSSKKEVTSEIVSETLGLPSDSLIDELLAAVRNGENTALVQLLDSLRDQAIDSVAVSANLSRKIRDSMLSESASSVDIQLLRNLLEISSSAHPRSSLEVCLLEACLASKKPSVNSKNVVANKATEVVVEKTPEVLPDIPKPEPVIQNGGFKLDDWPAVVSRVKEEAASLYTALRLAAPSLSDDKLTLAFQFPLHQKKVAEGKAKNLIGRIVEDLSGAKMAIECVVDKSIQPKIETVAPVPVNEIEPDEHTQTISNIFGGGELLES
ncbi:DNA polymerase III subunit gamma/tau [Candidatus Saccharibacteria bacterium]|nr:DNA polymerase III subunit gamma/tau [Candidatus Saccharibacteria bacterium]